MSIILYASCNSEAGTCAWRVDSRFNPEPLLDKTHFVYFCERNPCNERRPHFMGIARRGTGTRQACWAMPSGVLADAPRQGVREARPS